MSNNSKWKKETSVTVLLLERTLRFSETLMETLARNSHAKSLHFSSCAAQNRSSIFIPKCIGIAKSEAVGGILMSQLSGSIPRAKPTSLLPLCLLQLQLAS